MNMKFSSLLVLAYGAACVSASQSDEHSQEYSGYKVTIDGVVVPSEAQGDGISPYGNQFYLELDPEGEKHTSAFEWVQDRSNRERSLSSSASSDSSKTYGGHLKLKPYQKLDSIEAMCQTNLFFNCKKE